VRLAFATGPHAAEDVHGSRAGGDFHALPGALGNDEFVARAQLGPGIAYDDGATPLDESVNCEDVATRFAGPVTKAGNSGISVLLDRSTLP
jgi:hypothetical protein